MIERRRTQGFDAALWLFAAVASAMLAAPAIAQPTMSRSASIVIDPKIAVDDGVDTVLELANASNSEVSALCLYLDGATGLEVNFQLSLPAQVGLRWTASQGLLCPDATADCAATGALVPPVPFGFRGSLACVEIDFGRTPFPGNHLSSSASVFDLVSGDASAYQGIGLLGTDVFDGDDVLCLGPNPTAQCPSGQEYLGCPDQWLLQHIAEGAEDPLVGPGSSVRTVLTFFNCDQNFSTASASGSTLQLTIENEFEQQFTSSVALASAWAERSLEELDPIFQFSTLGTTYARTTIGFVGGGFAIVAREIRDTGGTTPASASAAFDLAHTGTATNDQALVLPPR